MHLAGVADLPDQPEHALAGRRVEAVGRLVQEQELAGRGRSPGRAWPAASCPASRSRPCGSAPRPDRRRTAPRGRARGPARREARELGHQPDEAHGGHAGDEGVVLGHVAHQARIARASRPDVVAEDPGRPRAGRVEAEQGVEQRGLAGAVRAQQADAAAGQGGVQTLAGSDAPRSWTSRPWSSMTGAVVSASRHDISRCSHGAGLLTWALTGRPPARSRRLRGPLVRAACARHAARSIIPEPPKPARVRRFRPRGLLLLPAKRMRSVLGVGVDQRRALRRAEVSLGRCGPAVRRAPAAIELAKRTSSSGARFW